MTVRLKTLLIVAVTCLGLIVVLYGASRWFVLGGFVKLEQTIAQENIQRVINALGQDFASIDRFTYDRAAFIEAYYGDSGPSLDVIQWMLGKNATGNIQTQRFNFMLLIDATNGRIVVSRGYDIATNQVLPVPESLKAHIAVSDPLLQTTAAKGKVNGVLLLPEGPLLVVCRPIFDPATGSRTLGYVLSARYLESGGDLQLLEKTTNFPLSAHRINGETLQGDLLDAWQHLRRDDGTYVRTLDSTEMAGYALIRDIYGQPALVLKARMQRRILHQGQVSQLYFVGSLGIAGLVFGVAVMLLLEKSVISRLSALNTSVAAVASSGDASARVHCPGRDELSHVGVAINGMLESMQLSQRQRQQAEERYRAFMNNIPAVASIKDREGRILYINEPMTRMFGVKLDEIRGKTLSEWMPEVAQAIRSHDQQTLAEKRVLQFEEVAKTPDGVLRHWLSFRFPLEEPDGQILIGAVGVDITDRKQAEAALQQAKEMAEAANRAKSEFLANMSHEIRTPLNGVVGMTDLALGTELSTEQREYLDTVKISADSLLTVINDILDFSKIEAGKIDLEMIDFEIRDHLETTLKTMAHRADEKGIELLCEIAPDVPEAVRGDSARLRQIIVNLVGNAIKFTDEGEVALKLSVLQGDHDARFLHFTVSDTGIGIEPEKQKSIFEPFTQADTSTTRKYGGTGLGLTISMRLVQMMAGKMWLESELGKGAQFHFTVPLLNAAERIEIGTPAPAELLRGVRVLIVDDNRTNRRILEGMLKRWEMIPSAVEGGAEGIAELLAAHAAGNPYGLIISDLLMPKMDGFGFVERVRQRPELSTAMIMLITSAGLRGDAARCEALGVSAYLMKPVRQSELREAIARVLGAREHTGSIPLITRYALADARDPDAYLRILVAEDNAVNQQLAARLLEKRGHRVMVTANGRQALEALEKNAYDLVLMDVQMPEMDGFEATIAIREREQRTGAHLPIIALTAHAMKGDRERCLAAGMDGYLSKPIRPRDLDEILEKYVTRQMTPAPTPEEAVKPS